MSLAFSAFLQKAKHIYVYRPTHIAYSYTLRALLMRRPGRADQFFLSIMPTVLIIKRTTYRIGLPNYAGLQANFIKLQ